MKKILLSISIVSLLFFAFTLPSEGEGEKYPSLKLGEKMPLGNKLLISSNGRDMSLNDVKKTNGTLVIFTCNTCPFVLQWEDRYDDIFDLAARFDIGVVLLNSNEAKRSDDDSVKKMYDHSLDKAFTAPYLVDEKSEIANAFGAKTTPHVFLFDSYDKLVYVGAIDDNSKDITAVKEKYLQNAMLQLYKGEEITTPKTDAKGCSIKR